MTSLRVFAASSLTEAFTEIAIAFEKENPTVSVRLDLGGSQRLRSQLEFGAKADIFASANYLQVEPLVAAGMVSGSPIDFASNELVVIAIPDGPVDVLQDLARPGVRVVMANADVPVGSYSRQVISNLASDPTSGVGSRFEAEVLANLVSEEPSVRFVTQKVALGEVDAGIVYRTDVPGAEESGAVEVIPIPDSANIVALYPLVVLEDTSELELAQSFVRFILSEGGKKILTKHGFGAP